MEKTELEDYQDYVAGCGQPSAEQLAKTDPILLKGWWASTQASNEAAELNELFEKAVRKGIDLDVDKVLDEVGDVLWGITCVCNTCGLSLDDALLHNMDKLNKRKAEREAKAA